MMCQYFLQTWLCLFLSLSTTIQSQNRPIHIIPMPVSVDRMDGSYHITNMTKVGFNNLEAQNITNSFVNKLNLATGWNLTPQNSENNDIQLDINNVHDKVIGEEGYKILVTNKGIILTANKPAGLFYGVQSMLQLLPKEITNSTETNGIEWTIPYVTISDYPRFQWRGIMLDVSRNFFSKEEVKKYIHQISAYKFNTFHWHLTDDHGWRIEIKSLPELTKTGAWRVERHGKFGSREDPKSGEPATVGGYYSHDDVREIIAYAAERYITIIPEIDVPGHSMAAIAAYPELSCTQDTTIKVNPGTKFSEWYPGGKFKMLIDNTLNPSDEKVYAFLDKVFTEIASLFPTPYIHVGGDECYKGYWEKDKNCIALMKKMNYKKVEELQGYFMNRVADILQKNGKKLLGWDEILEGGVSKDATIMSWRGLKGGIEGAKKGHQIVMTPTTYAYLDYYQGEKSIEAPVYDALRIHKSYSFEPVPDGVNPNLILGGQGNLWTEQIPTLRYAEYMTYPRAWALSEVFWTPKTNKNWDGFSQRMETHFDRYDVAQINYSKAVYDPIIYTKKIKNEYWIHMEKEISNMEIFYTLDGTMPDQYSHRYDTPFILPPGPITLRTKTFRKSLPLGHLIILDRAELEKRARN